MESKTGEYPPGHLYELTRPQFFSDLKQVAPEVIDDLNQKSAVLFTEFCRAFIETEQSRTGPAIVQYEAYDASLREWAKAHRLDETYWSEDPEWVLVEARRYLEANLNPELKALYEEYNHPKKHIKKIQEELRRAYGLSDSRNEFLNDFIEDTDGFVRYTQLWPNLTFASNGWNPFEEARSDAAERLTNEFKAHLETYLNEMEEVCRKNNISPVPGGFRRKQQKERLHFEWLIRFHVQGMPKNAIARKYGVRVRAVQIATPKEAGWIGLTRLRR